MTQTYGVRRKETRTEKKETLGYYFTWETGNTDLVLLHTRDRQGILTRVLLHREYWLGYYYTGDRQGILTWVLLHRRDRQGILTWVLLHRRDRQGILTWVLLHRTDREYWLVYRFIWEMDSGTAHRSWSTQLLYWVGLTISTHCKTRHLEASVVCEQCHQWHFYDEYKLSLLCFKIISHQAPIYLSKLLHLYIPSRQLRSSTDTRVFRIPSFRTKSCGQRSFS